jgi:GT2 family glycosyltransferase
MNRLPIVAAVPNYNMGEQLAELLPSLTSSGYNEICVLDDASTDDSRDIVAAVSTDIHFVDGKENRGAGTNRNRIITALGHDAIIHFMDADIRLDTERAAEVVANAIPSEAYGFVGGLAKTEAGFQNVWNYGPRQSLWANLGAQVQSRVEATLLDNPSRAAALRERFATLVKDWPDPLSKPSRRQVFWAIEQNLVVDSQTFAALGGFDENLREHEVQDLALRMAQCGLKRYFDPSFAITHKNIDVRHYNRVAAMAKAELMIARKHGLRNWLLPDGKIKPVL